MTETTGDVVPQFGHDVKSDGVGDEGLPSPSVTVLKKPGKY